MNQKIVATHEEVLQRYRELGSCREVAEELGVTRARVHQIVSKADPDKIVIQGKRRMAEITKLQARLAELTRALESATPCKVCGYWNVRGADKQFVTCSRECAQIWQQARYGLDPVEREAQRKRVARWSLKSEKSLPAQKRWAEKVLAEGYQATGVTYHMPGSRAERLMNQVGKARPSIKQAAEGQFPWLRDSTVREG